jgi:hypothetical protein
MTIRRKRRWVLEIIIGNDTNAVHLWTQITYPCEGRQVKHFWCSHFKTNIQTDNIHTYKEFVDSDLKVPMLHRNCKKKKNERDLPSCGDPLKPQTVGFKKQSSWSSSTMLTLVPVTPEHQLFPSNHPQNPWEVWSHERNLEVIHG